MQGFGASTEKIPIYMIKEADYTQEERLKKKRNKSVAQPEVRRQGQKYWILKQK